MPENTTARPHVVVIGSGFGGLTVTQKLAGAPVRVTLVDRTNHHTFQPLLYQVAMAGLSPAEIAQPIRSIVHRQTNATVLMAEVTRIDLERRSVELSDGASLEWDFLVVACGADTAYFGHDDWAKVAPGLKSIEDAIDIRQRVLLAFELAEREPDAKRRQELLSFVVIGGGPTGVELAGALAELSRYVLARDFRSIDPRAAKVSLLEAGSRILQAFPASLSERAVDELRELGVEVRTGARVSSLVPGRVVLGEESLPCSVAIWAAGVRANGLTQTIGAPLDRSGRVLVQPDLTVPGHPRAFVIGDAAILTGKDGKPLPGVSPVAMQEARAVARSIRSVVAGGAPVVFAYRDKGSMATIGRSRAIAQIQSLQLSGMVAWLAWLLVHLIYLVGFRNRLVVLITWAWSYLTYRRGARLITGYAAPGAIEALRRVHGPAPARALEQAPQRTHEPVPS
ncbi:MAG TPA: NAD(P)/FAD-dependent oxidoreductase [Polyangiaceae bacterium]|jgi:NADH dehydrogenase